MSICPSFCSNMFLKSLFKPKKCHKSTRRTLSCQQISQTEYGWQFVGKLSAYDNIFCKIRFHFERYETKLRCLHSLCSLPFWSMVAKSSAENMVVGEQDHIRVSTIMEKAVLKWVIIFVSIQPPSSTLLMKELSGAAKRRILVVEKENLAVVYLGVRFPMCLRKSLPAFP